MVQRPILSQRYTTAKYVVGCIRYRTHVLTGGSSVGRSGKMKINWGDGNWSAEPLCLASANRAKCPVSPCLALTLGLLKQLPAPPSSQHHILLVHVCAVRSIHSFVLSRAGSVRIPSFTKNLRD